MQNLWIIPALPFAGFLMNGIFGRKLPKALVSTIAILSVVLSFAWVLRVYLTAGDLALAAISGFFMCDPCMADIWPSSSTL